MIERIRAALATFRQGARDSRRYLSALARLRPYVHPHRGQLLLSCFAALGYASMTLLEPWPIRFLIDGVLLHHKVRLVGFKVAPHADPSTMILLSVGLVVLFAALRGQLYYVQNVATATAGQDVVMSLRRELFEHLQSLSIAYHRRGRLGDVLMRLTGDIVMLRDMVVSALVSVLAQGLVLVGVLVVMAAINLKLMLVALAVTPLLFLIISVFRVRLQEAASEQRKREGRLVSSMQEVIQSIHVVQANTAEPYEADRFRMMNQRSLRAGIRSTRLEAKLHRATQMTIAGGIGATLAVGAHDVLAGRLTPGQLIVFLAYVRGLYGPMRQVSKVVQRSAKASACADRVLEVLDERPEIASPPNAPPLRVPEGRVVLDRVTFGHDPDAPVLHDVTLEAPPGTTTAIVGPTGSGKTTLLNLIPRFFDPQRGEVRIDGTSVRVVSLRSLRGHISYLTQETVVMGVTIRENIAYGALGQDHGAPTIEEIEQAARFAHAHDFIADLPGGYDTVIGERGATLSGGQRQRIAIARALLREAPILLFDEPMTGLDPLAERAVREAFITLTRDRTTLVVAHQLETVLHADQIFFLENGRIVERGTHADLIAAGGRYAAFCRAHWSGVKRGEPAGPSRAAAGADS
ncbi:MAG TPA: ABC transporter ATP-binding protein [Candidatus Eisenbacteria bacterium]|nr:ABC transporter ATP-binding protein [Candidatus Eisenbacteria bacterium]